MADLPLPHEADKLRLVYSLWAEGFLSTAQQGPAGGAGGKKGQGKGGRQQQNGGHQQGKQGSGKAPTGEPPAKKAKKNGGA